MSRQTEPVVLAGEPRLIVFRGCYVRIFAEQHYLVTVFGDGAKVPAAPQADTPYLRRAQDLGYGDDTWAMCREHEVLHTLLAEALGHVWSATLSGVAHGRYAPRAVWTAEEGRVLAFQRFLRRGELAEELRIFEPGIDHLARTARALLDFAFGQMESAA